MAERSAKDPEGLMDFWRRAGASMAAAESPSAHDDIPRRLAALESRVTTIERAAEALLTARLRELEARLQLLEAKQAPPSSPCPRSDSCDRPASASDAQSEREAQRQKDIEELRAVTALLLGKLLPPQAGAQSKQGGQP